MTRELIVDDYVINDENDCYVIAEIGHNHQGDLDLCKEMFVIAKHCGANAVKLQKRNNRMLFTKEMYDSPYENRNSYGATYGVHREALEFDLDQYKELKDYASEIGITFFSTAFDVASADFLMELDPPAFKVASGDLNNTPLLEYIAKLGRPMFLSTGGGTMEAVQRAYETIMPHNSELCILQCTSGYPSKPEELNLSVVKTYRDRFQDCVIGLSMHDNGISMVPVGYVLGARVIEKHFTHNRSAKGTDHAFSLEAVGLGKMVRYLQRARAAVGDGVKVTYPSEVAPMVKMAKKLVAARDIAVGTLVSREDIAVKAPNDGLPPYEIDKVIGRRLKVDLKVDDNFAFEQLE